MTLQFCFMYTAREKIVKKIIIQLLKLIMKLKKYISERGKILHRRATGTCAAHQRALNTAIKRARHIGLLPFMTE